MQPLVWGCEADVGPLFKLCHFMLYSFLNAWDISWFFHPVGEKTTCSLFFCEFCTSSLIISGIVSFLPPASSHFFTGICWSIPCSILRMNFCTVLSLSPSLFLWGCVCVCVCVCVCIGVHYSILQTQLSTLLAFLKIHFSLLNSGRLPPSDWVLSHPAACKLSLIVSDNNHRVQLVYSPIITIDSVQFSCSVVSDSLKPHELSDAKPPCPSPIPKIYPNSCPLSWWCHPTISSSVIPFCPALNLSQHQGLFKWDSSSHQVAKVLEFQLQQLIQLP